MFSAQVRCVEQVERRGLAEVGIYRVPGWVQSLKQREEVSLLSRSVVTGKNKENDNSRHQTNFWPVLRSHGTNLTVRKFKRQAVQKFWTPISRSNFLAGTVENLTGAVLATMTVLMFSTAKAWFHWWVVTQQRDAILDLFKRRTARGQMIKLLTKVKIQLGWPVSREQSENIEQFLVN